MKTLNAKISLSEAIKLIIDTSLECKLHSMDEFEEMSVEINGESEKFYKLYSPDELHRAGYTIAALFIHSTSLGEQMITIVYDDVYKRLPDTVKKFINYHEIGHYVYRKSNHIQVTQKSSVIKRLIGCKSSLENEINADKFAVKKMGAEAVHSALIWMYQNINMSITSSREVLKRALHIQNTYL